MLSALNRLFPFFNRQRTKDASNQQQEVSTGAALTEEKSNVSDADSRIWSTITSCDEPDAEINGQQDRQDGQADSFALSDGNNSSAKTRQRFARRSRGLIGGALSRLSVRASRHRNEYVIKEDISNGREALKLPALSYLRHDKVPNGYHYVTEHVQYEPVGVDLSLANMRGCNCLGDCSDNCSCSRANNFGHFYDARGRLSPSYRIDAPEIIRECNVACKCNRKSCKNMVIQAGCQARLVLFKTRSRGWGVRTLDNLGRGTFVGVYSGELISVAASYKRQDDTYLFNLCNSHVYNQQQKPADCNAERPEDAKSYEPDADADAKRHQVEEPNGARLDEHNRKVNPADNQFVCDAKYYGNFTRFINHSCEPNVIGIRTFTVHQDTRFPYIAFFTNQDVPANSELTLNYGDNYWLVKCKRDKVYCLCKKATCRFTKKTFRQTLKLYEQQKRSN